MHQAGPTETGVQHCAECYLHAQRLSMLLHCQLMCQKWELFFLKTEVDTNGQCTDGIFYCLN